MKALNNLDTKNKSSRNRSYQLRNIKEIHYTKKREWSLLEMTLVGVLFSLEEIEIKC